MSSATLTVPDRYLQQVRPGVLAWLDSVRGDGVSDWGRWKYHSGMTRPWALIASGWALKLLGHLNQLHLVDHTRHQQAIRFLQSLQDPADGHFKDPLVSEADHVGKHSWEDIFGQMTGAALSGLGALGASPLHPLPKVFFLDPGQVGGVAYTRGFDWTNPWHRGEAWSRGIQAFYDALPPQQRTPLPRPLVDAFETYEREVVDPETGMPSRFMSPPNRSVAMAGLFKTMNAYLHVARPIPFMEQAIDFVLDLQHSDGEFGFRNNMCINWDALWVLLNLNNLLKGRHRFADIVEAGNRCAKLLLEKYRKPDGGFSFNGATCTINHHSVQLCAKPLPIGDMMGTIMSVHCLRYTDAWNDAIARGQTTVSLPDAASVTP